MPIVLDTTVGGAAAQSYADVAYATAYLQLTEYNVAWTTAAATADQQSVLLGRACRVLDTVRYKGRQTTATQRLQWPRYSVPQPYGGIYSSTAIPPALKDAQSLLAGWLAKSDPDGSADIFGANDTDKLSRLVVGPVELDFRSAGSPNTGLNFMATVILPMLEQAWLMGGSNTVRLTR